MSSCFEPIEADREDIMFRTIIVPVDLAHPEKGKSMIGLAPKLAGKNAQIVLITVVEDVPAYVATALPGGFIEKSKAEAHSILEGMAKAAKLNADVQVRSGSAHTAILALAAEKSADLIIVASHRPELADYLLGSTASRVVRHAKCSVLVMR